MNGGGGPWLRNRSSCLRKKSRTHGEQLQLHSIKCAAFITLGCLDLKDRVYLYPDVELLILSDEVSERQQVAAVFGEE